MSKQPRDRTAPPQDIGPRPFGAFVSELADGDLERRITSELAEIVRAVEDTGKPGKLQINILIGTDGKFIRVAADTKVTIPKPPCAGTQFFKDDRGGLHVENPAQVEMWPSGAVKNGAQVDLGERPAPSPAPTKPRGVAHQYREDDTPDPNDD